jgi:hypothetical protein
MLATSMSLVPSLFASLPVTQSMPQMAEEKVPDPSQLSTLTDHRRAPGAAPTVPISLSSAAAVPATCVPWPLPSDQASLFRLTQL